MGGVSRCDSSADRGFRDCHWAGLGGRAHDLRLTTHAKHSNGPSSHGGGLYLCPEREDQCATPQSTASPATRQDAAETAPASPAIADTPNAGRTKHIAYQLAPKSRATRTRHASANHG